jgi:hypothetical protein
MGGVSPVGELAAAFDAKQAPDDQRTASTHGSLLEASVVASRAAEIARLSHN